MSRVTFVRYTTKPEQADNNAALCRAMFAELRLHAPDDIAYAVFRGGDGRSFVHVFLNFAADDSTPLTDLPSFKAFEKGVHERCEEPPEVVRLGVPLIGEYGFERVRV